MQKVMLKKLLLLPLLLVSLLLGSLFAYEFTDKDWDLVDNIEDRLWEMVDASDDIDAGGLVAMIERIREERSLSERVDAFLEVIVEDTIYVYDLESADEREPLTLTAADCYEDEYFDADEEWCYPLDEGDEQDWSATNQEHHHDETDLPEDTNVYEIQGDKIDLIQGDTAVEHQEIWLLFAQLIPVNARTMLTQIGFYEQDSDTLAHVEVASDDSQQWHMYINLFGVYDQQGNITDEQELLATLIHEYAHVLTLNHTQVSLVADDVSDSERQRYQAMCQTYFLQEGCLKETSYLDDFISKFWTDNMLETVWEEEGDVYQETHFVTEYAATNPGEDIAESFAFFVLKPSITKPKTLADQKLAFFNNYPELVKLRSFIRSRLAD